VAANNISHIRRWLDRLEAQAGADDREDYGPTICVRFTAFWHEEGSPGELRERALIDAAVAEVQHEARERREHVGTIHALVNDRGEVEFEGVPWRPVGAGLAWTQGLYPRRDA
jgi:hypothetical protein